MQPRELAMTLGPEDIPRPQNRKQRHKPGEPAAIPGLEGKTCERYIMLDSERGVMYGREQVPGLRFIKITDPTKLAKIEEFARRSGVGMVVMPTGWKPGKKDPEE